MSEKIKKNKNPKQNNRTNMYIFLILAGAALIGVLVFLNLKFSEYMKLRNKGYAVVSGSISENLTKEPGDEEIKKTVELKKFKAEELLYEQNERIYLGEKKKTQVDTDYPVYLNEGSVLQLINDSAMLVDMNFEDVETYSGLMINKGYCYNIDGEQADASDYLFLKLANGNFTALKQMRYSKSSDEVNIAENSLVHFGKDYFSYYQLKNGNMIYGCMVSVNDNFVINIGGTDYKYKDLLVLLGLHKEVNHPAESNESEFDEDEEDSTTVAIGIADETNPDGTVIKEKKTKGNSESESEFEEITDSQGNVIATSKVREKRTTKTNEDSTTAEDTTSESASIDNTTKEENTNETTITNETTSYIEDTSDETESIIETTKPANIETTTNAVNETVTIVTDDTTVEVTTTERQTTTREPRQTTTREPRQTTVKSSTTVDESETTVNIVATTTVPVTTKQSETITIRDTTKKPPRATTSSSETTVSSETTKREKTTRPPRPPKETTTPEPTSTKEVIETTTEKDTKERLTRGQRPDWVRPDKPTGGEKKEKETIADEYVKPDVKVENFKTGVYKITADVTVHDPKSRIDKSKQVQFEVYEVSATGKEVLKARAYYKTTGTVTLGNGVIMPDTKYRVISYFTYHDEYDETVVEPLADEYFTTKDIDTLGVINLVHESGLSYNNHAEIVSFGYGNDEDGNPSDEEAIYGIDLYAGITIKLNKKGNDNVVTTIRLSSDKISNFKKLIYQTITSLSVLEAKTEYEYTIYVNDYFGNELKVSNNKGTYITSNNAPVGTMSVKKNEIGDFELACKINDEDLSAIPTESDSNAFDVYVAIRSERGEINGIDDIDTSAGDILYKLTSDDYTYDSQNGLKLKDDFVVKVTNLKLDTRYFAYMFCDYDLSNNAGPQRFKQIGMFTFTSAGLASLGRIYVNGKISNTRYNSTDINIKLNTKSTDPQLYNLITSVKLKVKKLGETVEEDEIGFEKSDVYINEEGNEETDADGNKVMKYQKFIEGKGLDFTTDGFEHVGLKSMTDYVFEMTVIGEYEGEEIELSSYLDNVNFTTLRQPADVQITDLVFAAGTLQFGLFVDDPDGAITGNSGQKVVINLYTSNGRFVKAIRATKNEYHEITFNNLDSTKKYQLRFVAVEYNEAYSNTTLQTNVILKTVDVKNSLNMQGIIKLQGVDSIENDDVHYLARTKTTLIDPEKNFIGTEPMSYYIKIEKDGELVSDGGVNPSEYKVDTPTNATNDYTYEHYYDDKVEIGNHTYKYTLYVIINNRELALDTLEFTTERTAKGFSTAYELIKLLQDDNRGKYIALNDIVLYSDKNGKYMNYKNPSDGPLAYTQETRYVENPDDPANPIEQIVYLDENGDTHPEQSECVSGAVAVEDFYGIIDCQGFAIEHHYYTNLSRFITNMSTGSEFRNVVYNVYVDATISGDGVWTYRNFGSINNIIVNYKGGSVYNHRQAGLLVCYNGSTGIVERFVLNNTPGDDLVGFTGEYRAALGVSVNYGIVRYGYAYGNDIIITLTSGTSMTREMGAIVAYNCTIGNIYSVYSLVNMRMDEIENQQGASINVRYGAVAGYTENIGIKKVYSIGLSRPAEDKTGQTSPVVGAFGGTAFKDIYYWNDINKKFTGKISSPTILDNLYNSSWQLYILTNNFDVTPVEIGYYPQVKLNDELPEQDYISLPNKTNNAGISISQAVVNSYTDAEDETQTDSAEVRFVFYNPSGYDITGIEIKDLDVKLDTDTAESEDGYTTIYGTVSNPQKFDSVYNINKIIYVNKNKKREEDISYDLRVDFYRRIYNADDWYQYVVKKSQDNCCENVKLMKDIDFDDVDIDKMIVTGTFTAKLNGNNHAIENIDLQKDFRIKNNSTARTLFNNSTLSVSGESEIFDLVVKNYKSGGEYKTGTTTYVARYAGLCYLVRGTIRNVHIIGIDVKSYDTFGGIAANADLGAQIQDCSVSASDTMGAKFTHIEPSDQSTTAAVGAIVGKLGNSRISNCFATDIEISVMKTKISNGVGGIVGYASGSVVDTAYAVGRIESRASRTGGIIGYYYTTTAAVPCARNLYSKVDITSYTNEVGGIIGLSDITSNMISDTNNISGVAFGNVYAINPDIDTVSHTVGAATGRKIKFYGSEMQLINGQLTSQITEAEQGSVLALLPYESFIGDNAKNTYFNRIGMENVIDVKGDEYLPKMYYQSSTTEMPYQKDIPLSDDVSNNLKVQGVSVDENAQLVVITLKNPDNLELTGVEILKLKYYFANAENETLHRTPEFANAVDTDNGISRIYLKYENNQDRYQDSYELVGIKYKVSGVEKVLKTDARIGVTLYREIASVEDWNNIPKYGDYENFKVTANIDFTNKSIAAGLKIGRLVGSGNITISNINLKNVYLIETLNSEISGLTFKNVNINSYMPTGVGLICVNNGSIKNCKFNDVILSIAGKVHENGLICHQNGGSVENITLNNIQIQNNNRSVNNTGSLIGNLTDVAKISNVEATNISVGGGQYVGGVFGNVQSADVSDITVKDVKISAMNSMSGGVFGQVGASANTKSYVIKRINVYGTPRFDGNKVVGSSTEIFSTNGYVGGAIGRSYEFTSTTSKKDGDGVNVEGCHIKGVMNYIGGAYGYCYSNPNNVYVKNTLVEASENASRTSYSGVGGVIGYQDLSGNSRYNTAEDVYVKSKYHNNVGGVAGYLNSNSSYVDYYIAKKCIIEARKNSAEMNSGVGGTFGRTNGAHVQYCGAINVNVNANDMEAVGGLVGYAGSAFTSGYNIRYSYYIAEPEENKAVAKDAYKIEGRTKVGGLVGHQEGVIISYSYSNANVIAKMEENGIAGGITGYYNNQYRTSQGANSYATTRLNYSYFVGTVDAGTKGYAGGAIGRTGLRVVNGLTTGSRDKASTPKTGSNNESEFTYRNMIMADSIKGGLGKTGFFCGDDTSLAGKLNVVWDGTKLYSGSATSYYMRAAGDNTGDKGFGYKNGDYWYSKDGYSADTWDTLKFFSSEHLEDGVYSTKEGICEKYEERAKDSRYAYFKDRFKMGVVFMRSVFGIGWYSSDKNNDPSRSYYIRFTVKGAHDQLEEQPEKDDGNYLPQMRSTNSKSYLDGNYKNDYNIKMQSSVGRLVVPHYTEEEFNASNKSQAAEEFSHGSVEEGYATVYASDADKINVEFAEELVGAGDYTLYVGGKEVVSEQITNRVYTFAYSFKEDIKLVCPMGIISVTPEKLARRIMVFGNEYYYIDKDKHLVHGNDDTSSVDSTRSYVTLMNGKALDSEGNVIDVEKNEAVRQIEASGTKLEKIQPLFVFKYDKSTIFDYSRCSKIVNDNDEFYRSSQIFVNADGMYTIEGELENQKDGVILYKLDGKKYLTILGDDGIMTDLYNGDKFNLPESVDNKNIAFITNTMYANVSYVLIEYNDGGIVGYNYATKKVLFDNSSKHSQSLTDYVSSYFEEAATSKYSDVSDTYIKNSVATDNITSDEQLEEAVLQSGINADGTNTENSTGIYEEAHSYTGIETPSEGQTTLTEGNLINDENGELDNSALENSSNNSEDAETNGSEEIESGIDNSESDDSETDNSKSDDLAANDPISTDNSKSDDSVSTDNNEDESVAAVGDEFTSNNNSELDENTDANINADNSSEVNNDSADDNIDNANDNENATENTKTESDNLSSGSGAQSVEHIESGADSENATEEYLIAGENISSNKNYITTYNTNSGVYEIVNIDSYLTDKDYVSENERLGVVELAEVVETNNGFAIPKEEKDENKGIIMYIAAIGLLVTVAVGLYEVRKKKDD